MNINDEINNQKYIRNTLDYCEKGITLITESFYCQFTAILENQEWMKLTEVFLT